MRYSVLRYSVKDFLAKFPLQCQYVQDEVHQKQREPLRWLWIKTSQL